MPAMHFDIRWPDATESHCYSPSLIIQDYFVVGERYALTTFLKNVREALQIASERVHAKFGFSCSAANDQLAQIEKKCAEFSGDPNAHVDVLAFHI